MPTLREMDTVCGQLQTLSYKMGNYKTMQADAVRTSLLKRTFPGLEPLRWINCYDSGLIYLAALAYEVRGIGIVLWDNEPSEITGKSLGHDDAGLLRGLAIMRFREARGCLEMMSWSTSKAAVSNEVELGLKVVQTATAEAFDEFDNYIQTKLGYVSRERSLSPANFTQEHDSRSSALGEAYSLRELEDRLEEVSKAYDGDTQSIELQRKLFEAGRYKDMEAEIKRACRL